MSIRNFVKDFGYLIVKLSDFGRSLNELDLTGDRDIEWSWVAASLPNCSCSVLDFGCGDTYLGLIAAMKGGSVLGLDLQQFNRPYSIDNLRLQEGDILDIDLKGDKFDVIINCSSIEHVGLAGRFGSKEDPDGDMIAMQRLRSILKSPDGLMILTIPVGIDSVFAPLHRVYGVKRLNQLLEGFSIIKSEFWSKRSGTDKWIKVNKEEALATKPSKSFYALGLFLLNPDS